MTLSKLLVPGTLVALALLTGAALADELPTFEVKSLPATPHQLTVVGASQAEERAPAAELTRAGMPATQHQVAVLTPHRHNAALAMPTTVSAVRN